MKYFIFMLTFCNIYVIIIKTKIVYENFNKLKSRGELDMRKKILAIALATIIFKDKFTKEERQSGPVNFIMGLAFITEGAIPYAASDPLHVLPACIIGAGVSGLSEVFNCTLMAPHGGIFVFPVVGNALMYLVALVIGTAVSTALLGLFKKKIA
jgi:PTS system fructose-specific IIC component